MASMFRQEGFAHSWETICCHPWCWKSFTFCHVVYCVVHSELI